MFKSKKIDLSTDDYYLIRNWFSNRRYELISIASKHKTLKKPYKNLLDILKIILIDLGNSEKDERSR